MAGLLPSILDDLRDMPRLLGRNPKQRLFRLGMVVAGLLVMLVAIRPFTQDDMIEVQASAPKQARLSELVAVGLGLSEHAAAEIKAVKRQHTEQMKVKGLTDEGVIEPVTDADERSNRIFVNGYRQQFPGINILSEEADGDQGFKPPAVSPVLSEQIKQDVHLDMEHILLTIDPLDATKEFTEDLLDYVTTMVCVVYHGKPMAGIINQVFNEGPPVWGIVPIAGSNEPLHGRAAKVPQGDAADTVTISRSHTGEGKNVVEEYLTGKHALLAGGSGYKSLLVVDGKADAYAHVTKIKSWDVCAADAIIKSIGGKFTDGSGEDLVYVKESPLFSHGILATRDSASHSWYMERLRSPFKTLMGGH
ncbi:unnamed protein product [Chrysoparadoxa australica]